jgi:antitoxin component YwqK of YwqJK toxin-antitoxin module
MKTIIISAFFLCLTTFVKSQDTGNLNQDGKHVVYYQNGNVKAQGNYVNNKREGEWLCYYNQNGGLLLKVDDIAKINEKAEVALYENNKVKSKGTFVNGKKEGDFIINNQVEVKKSF